MSWIKFAEKHAGVIVEDDAYIDGKVLRWMIVGYCEHGVYEDYILVKCLNKSGVDLCSLSDIGVLHGKLVLFSRDDWEVDAFMFVSKDRITELIESSKLPKHSRHRHKFSPIKFR